jgi:haloalkane dehalogenase
MTKTIALDRPSPGAAYPFTGRYVKVKGHNIHYIEEGNGQPVLFIHGNPTSSYVYRNVIPAVAEATNRRCLAIDLLGFGKSDKPTNIDYTLPLFTEIISSFIEELRLRDIILVAEDWGGFLDAKSYDL